ncbi:sulfatase [Algisphaera agarilytica]|uniref:Arylsulfatase A-like enzyme n=1 Tax=Algisphaera agarilytica TaxID=1385975 RepID=A0A7X0H7A2_9BACT|nr:sulfatase [Algisphaera agarilytica]MBB6429115.1 arylsulfatase A-like enzyme [Algisphaera agarilytica]
MRILYIDLDALNPSHLGCYGYHRATSPTVDQIAQGGIVFNNVYCSDAPCLPSRTAFYQSRFGIKTGVVGHGGTAADPKRQGVSRNFRSDLEEDSFPRQLQKLGYHTAMISPFGQRHAAHHFYAGFHEIYNTGQGGGESVARVQPVVERWLQDQQGEDNWYLHLNYWDIHTPYRTPLDYGNPFKDTPLADWYTDEVIAEHVKRGGPHSAQDLDMYQDADSASFPRMPVRILDWSSLEQWIDGYDVAIRYVDDALAKICELLKKQGVYEDTAIIISADHGENQGDLGIYGEHGTADHGTCHIPFIVKWPGARSGVCREALHYHLDWAPTCLDLLDADSSNLKAPEAWDGQSFATSIVGDCDRGRNELVLSQCAHVCQRSVRFNYGKYQWLYMRTYHDGFHPFSKHMLFDLAQDPHEQRDVARLYPQVLKEATWRLLNWHDEAMASNVSAGSDVTDPMYTVLHEGGPFHARAYEGGRRTDSFSGYLERLRQSGREVYARGLDARYPSL